jgi:hypothetical protein
MSRIWVGKDQKVATPAAKGTPKRGDFGRALDLIERLSEALALCDLREEGANGFTRKQASRARAAELDAHRFLEANGRGEPEEGSEGLR